ncbi:hypothetical protein H696_01134 [Fonticula alba]|uniref:Uncharacterized protein n=1 Tax=Fonticula alba TaxID=691883 RepID=A0A058ZCP5_FONAL|nr:hypothetical protein H696_01134 [Fonticula alba]KCV71711.1 hypothetical protein H696_01134 [Fonticula alba]|eukprot:XP_009493289.1 hypothetical protein H696_01134 [Fonticula alba]
MFPPAPAPPADIGNTPPAGGIHRPSVKLPPDLAPHAIEYQLLKHLLFSIRDAAIESPVPPPGISPAASPPESPMTGSGQLAASRPLLDAIPVAGGRPLLLSNFPHRVATDLAPAVGPKTAFALRNFLRELDRQILRANAAYVEGIRRVAALSGLDLGQQLAFPPDHRCPGPGDTSDLVAPGLATGPGLLSQVDPPTSVYTPLEALLLSPPRATNWPPCVQTPCIQCAHHDVLASAACTVQPHSCANCPSTRPPTAGTLPLSDAFCECWHHSLVCCGCEHFCCCRCCAASENLPEFPRFGQVEHPALLTADSGPALLPGLLCPTCDPDFALLNLTACTKILKKFERLDFSLPTLPADIGPGDMGLAALVAGSPTEVNSLSASAGSSPYLGATVGSGNAPSPHLLAGTRSAYLYRISLLPISTRVAAVEARHSLAARVRARLKVRRGLARGIPPHLAESDAEASPPMDDWDGCDGVGRAVRCTLSK